MSTLRHIEGHLDEQRAEAREHLAQHFDEVARRLRASEIDPCGVAAVVLLEDGTRDFEVCAGDGVETLALGASLQELARAITESS
ncbi:MAG: hypothetical protein ACOCUS_07270 [Polyangiales bacterium]